MDRHVTKIEFWTRESLLIQLLQMRNQEPKGDVIDLKSLNKLVMT